MKLYLLGDFFGSPPQPPPPTLPRTLANQSQSQSHHYHKTHQSDLIDTRKMQDYVKHLTYILCMIILCITTSNVLTSVHCQQNGADLGAESRADPALAGRPLPANALEQLANFFNNYQAAANRRQIAQLPPQFNNQRIPQSSNGVVFSTPSSIPIGAGSNFQSRRVPPQQFGGQNSPMPVSSPPPMPYLTLNRIPTNQQQNNQPRLTLQPINTIPLGSLATTNGQQLQQHLQPNRANSGQRQQMPARPIGSQNGLALPRPPQQINPAPVKPMAGFAPSGPPPNPMNPNNAMVVVQSPPNGVGSPSSTSSAPPPATSQDAPTTTTTPATETSSAISQNDKIETSASSDAATITTTTESAVNPSNNTWNPVDANRRPLDLDAKRPAGLAPSPDIVTVPPDYNPEQANRSGQTYDISVSAQMGTPSSRQDNSPQIKLIATSADQNVTSDRIQPSSVATPPTAVTTIFWSPPNEEQASTPPQVPKQILTQNSSETSKSSETTPTEPSSSQTSSNPFTPTSQPPTRTRANSSIVADKDNTEISGVVNNHHSNGNDKNTNTNQMQQDSPVVYGHSNSRDSHPNPPSSSSSSSDGKAFVQPAQLDSQVRPFASSAPRDKPFKASRPFGGDKSSVASGFSIVPGAGNQSMPTGDIHEYLAKANSNEPTISALGGPDPADPPAPATMQTGNSSMEADQTPPSSTPATSAPPRIRRPTFKPKPANPLIRIDSCIVGDDNSCTQSHNERCITEYGISSCHCKPGFARQSLLRGYCSPISALQLNMKIDHLSDDRRLTFNSSLDDPNSGEYQYLEFEVLQALSGVFQQTSSFGKHYISARVNKFFAHKGKVHANVTVNLEANNVTKAEGKIQQLASQELHRVTQQHKNKPLGDSTVILDVTPISKDSTFSRLTDLNECSNKDLNDCSKYATCTNEFGGFQCQCLPGYEDKFSGSEDKSKHGRVCLGCSASYCSNRGECSIVEGQKQCKCRPNFLGSRCDIDSEVLATAIGGSLVGIIILLITFWCLFIFNRRWKREQQKMDAISAASGLTFNYVNSAANSLMSPGRFMSSRPTATGRGELISGGASAARFALGRSGASANLYGSDQQAIMGSTSSSSSATSQHLANCASNANPYAAANYQYDEAAGLLLAPTPSGSSQQTSPSGHSNRGFVGNSYTLSGHHHHLHHHHPQYAHLAHPHHHQHLMAKANQFNPAAEFSSRSLKQAASVANLHCPTSTSAGYDPRWMLVPQLADKQSALLGYYLTPDTLLSQQQQQQQPAVYASPQRELCVDTGNPLMHSAYAKANRSRQQGRSSNTMRSRSQSQGYPNSRSMYHSSECG